MTSNTVDVRGYGSFQNALFNQTRSLEPQVGMGATELMYSDRHPFTIVEILSPKRIVVQADKATRKDDRGFSESQQYIYEPQPESPKIVLFLNKHGRWKARGNADGSTFLIGKREEYYDFTR